MTQYPDIRLRKFQGVGKPDLFEVAEGCRVDLINQLLIIDIPSGYLTDFASVPQWLWSIFPPHGRMASASVLHDYMYDNRMFETELGADLARSFADRLFLKNMLDAGTRPFQAHLYYWAVRWFGRKWWID